MDARKTTAMALAALALTAAPAAHGAVDYTKNAATGDYAPAITPASGTAASSADDGFAWGDAAVGAGAALALALLAAPLRGRRTLAPARHGSSSNRSV